MGSACQKHSHLALGRMFLRLDIFFIFRPDQSLSVQRFFQFAEQMNAELFNTFKPARGVWYSAVFPFMPSVSATSVASGNEQHSRFSLFQFVQFIVPNYSRGSFRNLSRAGVQQRACTLSLHTIACLVNMEKIDARRGRLPRRN